MRGMKKLIRVLFFCAMLLGVLSVTAAAAPGSSFSDPVVCDTFEEFKAAMEDPDIIYVSLHAVDEVLPLLEEGRRVAAITVKGEKDLYLANDSVATFVANANGGVYDSLLQVGAGSSLSIDGNRGWLVFEAVGTAAHNAVIYNEGGDVSIYGGYLKGQYNTATYGRAIWQNSGTLTIEDGDFESMDGTANKVGNKETCAVYLAGGSAQIRGGKFYVEETKDPEAEPYGLYIEEGAEVEISGGIFYGIRPPDNTAVGNYIADGCEMTLGGALVDPMYYGIIAADKRVTVGQDLLITEIKSKISPEIVARAGMEVRTFMPNVPDGVPYSRPWNGASWHDEYGVVIDAPEGLHYDNGYQFEAGRTYYADYKYTTDYGYVFAENPTVTLTGPDPSMFTYEIIDRADDGRQITVRYTFTIPGEFSYPDINKVSLIYIGGYAQGAQKPDWSELIYNNCTMTREEWNAGTWGSECDWEIDSKGYKHFKAGKTYVHMIELTAKDGYKFSEELLVQKGDQYDEEIGEVVLSNDRTVATVTYTYTIAGMEYLEYIHIDPKAGDDDFYLIRGDRNLTSGLPFTTYYKELDQPDLPYELQNSYEWYDVETGKEMRYGVADQELELGKQYRLEFNIDIKDEYYDTIRFDEDTKLLIDNYLPGRADYVQIETKTFRKGSGQMHVEITYTVQPKPGEGRGQHYPVMCYTYDEFKYAMENDDIRYVALGDVEDTLPRIAHDPAVPDNRTNAIVVRGQKVLNLLGKAVFTCPMVQDYDYKTYEQLITLSSAANTKLDICGQGSLTFNGGNSYFFNSVIKVAGGSLVVQEATIRGSNGNHTGYCYGINALYGGVTIQDDATIRGGVYSGDGICAMSIGEEGLNESLSVTISSGNFYVDRKVNDGNHDHGIWVNNDCGLRIHGGTFEGIKLGRYADDNLSYYVQDDCIMTIDGQTATPAYYGTITDRTVEVYKGISKVDIHVNSPAAGKVPATTPAEVYLVPDGCTVKSIQWYENGELWADVDFGSAYFEPGNTYKVEIVLVTDNGVKFADPLTSATINYKKATVNAHAGNAQKGIVMTVDLGECPNTIQEVMLTVTAPKEGNKPSYSVGLSSDAYKLVGNYNNYKDYRTWYMSSDGDEWWQIDENHTFMSGYYYKFVVDIQTKSGYEFAVYDDGSRIMPNVAATVNGYYAKVIKAYDQDPSAYITVEYNFGECNDSIVEKVAVVDVVAPVAGERPSYTYNILGSGYQMNTAENAYYDVYWKNPPEKWYYIKNGIGWYDVTEEDWVYEHETFIPGHEYKVNVYLYTEDGYEFAHDKWYDMLISATVNGKTAGFKNTGSDCAWYQQITYTFTCEQKDVSAVILYDLAAPQAGKTPDTEVTAAYPELYEVTDVRWLDEEDNEVTAFEQGRLYTVELTVSPKDYSGIDGCVFANSVTAYIDGAEVTGWSNKVTTNQDNTLSVRYGFRKGASAPEIDTTPKIFISQPKSGAVFAGETFSTSWKTSFTPDRFEIMCWDGEAWDQYDCLSDPDNGEGEYDFRENEAGAVRFRIDAYLNGEVAASSQFTVTWKEPVSAVWNGKTCTVKLEQTGINATVMAAVYDGGKLVQNVILTGAKPSAALTGDSVSVFFLNGTHVPTRAHIEF